MPAYSREAPLPAAVPLPCADRQRAGTHAAAPEERRLRDAAPRLAQALPRRQRSAGWRLLAERRQARDASKNRALEERSAGRGLWKPFQMVVASPSIFACSLDER